MQLLVFTVVGLIAMMIAYAFALGGTVGCLIFLFVIFNGVLDRWATAARDWIRACDRAAVRRPLGSRRVRFGVLTGGGDCPGLNAVIRADRPQGHRRLRRTTIVGFRDGWRGPLEETCTRS